VSCQLEKSGRRKGNRSEGMYIVKLVLGEKGLNAE
jgi:hypothetical protein